MMRTILLLIIALGTGVLGGAAVMHARSEASLADAVQQKTTLQRELDQAREKERSATETLKRVQDENERNFASIQHLQEELNRARLAAVAQPGGQVPITEGEGVDLASLFDFGEPLPRTPLDEGEADRRRGRGERDNMTEEEREQMRQEWTERRTEWAQRARDGMYNMFAEAAQASTDPAEQQRLTAMAEYSDAMFELRQQMRDAQTDEERDQLRALMQQNMGDMRDMMRDQQNHMLSSLAQQHGVDQPRQFTQQLRETMESPFFRGGGGLAPQGGFGGPQGGFGGGGPRGGGEGGWGGITGGGRGGGNTGGRGSR